MVLPVFVLEIYDLSGFLPVDGGRRRSPGRGALEARGPALYHAHVFGEHAELVLQH